ncbi:MAG: recombinase family protein [Pirellulales bacterium]
MKIVACYIRVSTGGKNEAGQRREINQWLKSKRIKAKTVGWYVDKSTAKKLRHQAFEKLQTDIANREIGTVVIWRLDRLSSTMSEGLSILCDWSKKPLRIVSVNQDIDFTGGAGKTIAAVVQGLAEMAFETKREQSKVALAKARTQGRFPGRPPVTADDVRVQMVKKSHKDAKLSIDKICEQLKISRTTYFRYLDL